MTTPFAKLQKHIISATRLNWIDTTGEEQSIKFGGNHKILYTYLFDQFHYHKESNKRVTFSIGWLEANTGISDRTIKRLIGDLSEANVLILSKSHKPDGTYNVTQYLDVIDIVSSPKHKLVAEKLKTWYKMRGKSQYDDRWDYKQIKQYQDNKAFIQATEGRYMTSQEQEKAHLESFKSGVAFKFVDSV